VTRNGHPRHRCRATTRRTAPTITGAADCFNQKAPAKRNAAVTWRRQASVFDRAAAPPMSRRIIKESAWAVKR